MLSDFYDAKHKFSTYYMKVIVMLMKLSFVFQKSHPNIVLHSCRAKEHSHVKFLTVSTCAG